MEERRREREQQHEERMMSMFLSFFGQMTRPFHAGASYSLPSQSPYPSHYSQPPFPLHIPPHQSPSLSDYHTSWSPNEDDDVTE